MWDDLLNGIDIYRGPTEPPGRDWTTYFPKWAQRLPLRLYFWVLVFIWAVFLVTLH
jgi:hypothetical protein